MDTELYFHIIRERPALMMSSRGFEHEIRFEDIRVQNSVSVSALSVRGRFMIIGVSQQQCSSQEENKKECRRFYLELFIYFLFYCFGTHITTPAVTSNHKITEWFRLERTLKIIQF